MTENTRTRRPRFSLAHRQASPIRITFAAARPGVGAHREYTVTTACDRPMTTTLVTRSNDHVQCVDCLEAIATPVPDDRVAGPACERIACSHESCWMITWPQFAKPAPAGQPLVLASRD